MNSTTIAALRPQAICFIALLVFALVTMTSSSRATPLAETHSARLDESIDARNLRVFAALLAEKHSYTVATGQRERIAARIEAFITRNPGATGEAVAREMASILGESVDGHAELTTKEWNPEQSPFLQVLLMPAADAVGSGVVGVAPDRSSLLDPARPYVVAINDIGIEQLLVRAQEFVANGSPALVRERACRLLRSAWLSGDAGELKRARVALAASAFTPREEWRTVEIAIGPTKPIFGEWPMLRSTQMADGKIGYLRIPSMSGSEALTDAGKRLVDEFAGCDSLLIDVRGNSGGSRAGLVSIAGALMPATQPSVVYNVARALRMGDTDAAIEERMASRFMVPLSRAAPNDREVAKTIVQRATGEARGATFDEPQFSEWFIGVVQRTEQRSWWRPGRRVVVLMDNVCFSATDVFLMAMKEIEGVTLLGRPSAGGSGLGLPHQLPNGARVRLSSMVSFQPDGGLLDGRGVQPDVLVWPIPTDFVRGGTDTLLDAALKELSKD